MLRVRYFGAMHLVMPKYVSLETPIYGGHVGFTLAGKEENWMEVRAFKFISHLCHD
ncbi:MAG: hypothetical protein ACKVOQ_04835 [Cyclobacteriaceae bacterium]